MKTVSLNLAQSLLATALTGTFLFAVAPAVAEPDRGVSSQAAVPKPGTGNFVQRLIGELRSSDMEVSVGYARVYTQADCAFSYPVFHNCFGNNPASPYLMPVVQSWPDEYVDPAMKNGFGRTRPGYSVTYRLDPREAIILFGRMPPPARYMGLQTWILTSGWLSDDSPWNRDACSSYASLANQMTQYFFGTVPPVSIDPTVPNFPYCATVPGGPSRVQSFASIDNNINNVVMEKKSGPPWNEIRYFVITPDQRTDAAVRQALVSLGVDEDEIFTEGIPKTFHDPDHAYPYGQNPVVGPLGLGEDSVDFTTAVRYAMPDDEQAAHAWLQSLPLTVLRVRRVPWGPAAETYGDRTADPRPTVDETKDEALVSGLQTLVAAVIARAKSQGWTLVQEAHPEMVDIVKELGQFGPACRQIGMNCLADGQDASYFFAQPRPLDTGRIYAAVGTLARETGNATYVGLSVNDASLLKGALNVDDTKLKGSASSYHSAVPNPATLEKFFVHFFARDCAAIVDLTDGECTTVTTDMIPLAGDVDAPGDPALHGMFSIAVRAYVKPGSERGPDPTKQLPPYRLTFTYE
ncbi:MAG: hypothetical protein FIB00_16010 [Chloroflexi bacterium]|nr:hypothetical protein [Chloroflexota bacterium]